MLTKRKSVSKGFTLVELLVVIGVIVIMVAIMFPVISNAMAKANAITCLSNIRQLGAATFMYLQDNDESFPMVFSDANGDGKCDANDEITWTQEIASEGNNDITKLRCPSCNAQSVSYGMGWWLQKKQEADITNPMDTPMIADATTAILHTSARYGVRRYLCSAKIPSDPNKTNKNV